MSFLKRIEAKINRELPFLELFREHEKTLKDLRDEADEEIDDE